MNKPFTTGTRGTLLEFPLVIAGGTAGSVALASDALLAALRGVGGVNVGTIPSGELAAREAAAAAAAPEVTAVGTRWATRAAILSGGERFGGDAARGGENIPPMLVPRPAPPLG